jgi:inositol phosphorylceramide mannosyltransferase catalytic subunit
MKRVLQKISLLLSILFLCSSGVIDARRTTKFNEIFIPFNEAMKGHPYVNAVAACDAKSEWQLVKKLYIKFLIEDLDWSDEPSIPKVIHHIWLGSPLPEKCRILRETWIKNHPGWEFVLWTDADIERFGLENKEIYDASTNWGEKSDIARYEIIYKYGGLYVDTDYESVKPMDVLHHCLDFYTGIYANHARGNSPNMTMGMGLIGARPGHPILRAAIDGLKGTPNTKNNNSSAILSRTGPYYWTRIVLANAEKDGLRNVVLPPMFVYPTPISGRGQSLEDQHKNFFTNSTFANHVWHMSWIVPHQHGKKK